MDRVWKWIAGTIVGLGLLLAIAITYDEALFLEVMHTGSVKARKLSSIMPVMVYRNLTDDDLKAMFAFLRTVKPVKHRVDNSASPTACRVCGLKHGGGEQN